MALQPRRRPPAPKVEPVLTPTEETVEEVDETVEEAPRCRVYDDSGAHRCVKPLGHVGDGDPDHEFESADE